MLRVTTLYASSAVATAAYYTRYLAGAPGEEPGRWLGRQADGLGLAGRVGGRRAAGAAVGPRSDRRGRRWALRWSIGTTSDGRLVRAVAGFDATFSAPKSRQRLVGAHRRPRPARSPRHRRRGGAGAPGAVRGDHPHPAPTAAGCIPTPLGLAMATFRQTTSRATTRSSTLTPSSPPRCRRSTGAGGPSTPDYLKRHQRMLGGLYQSVLRAELTHRYGIAWAPIVNGQAEIAGIPGELLEVFSKRTVQVDAALADTVEEFRAARGTGPDPLGAGSHDPRGGRRHPTHARPALSTVDLRARWQGEAGELGWTAERLVDRSRPSSSRRARADAGDRRAGLRSPLRGGVDMDPRRRDASGVRPGSAGVRQSGQQWAAGPRSGHRTRCSGSASNLDPDSTATRRASDGRSVWLEPDQSPLHVPSNPGRGGTNPHLGHGGAGPPTRHHRPPSIGTASTSSKPTPPPP